MHPLMLGIEILTLVPNHLSTVKSTNPRPPYHTLNPQNHQKNTPKIKKPTQPKGWGEDEGSGEREKGEKKGSGEVER